MARRFKLSGLDEKPALADFDWRFNPKLPRAACFELHTLKFLGEGANALIVGKPGTGKSHIAKAVAYQATLQGHDVAYVEADSEFALQQGRQRVQEGLLGGLGLHEAGVQGLGHAGQAQLAQGGLDVVSVHGGHAKRSC
jgi:DNA replication protein DnaC